MGYRPSYLALRALHHARTHPPALAMLGAFRVSAAADRPRLDDDEARAYLRSRQTLRQLGRRRHDARGGSTRLRRSRSAVRP
jgi:hypothetical protein